MFGFASVVVAHSDSRPAGRLYGTVLPAGQITDSIRAEVEQAHQRNLDQALAENAVALVHMHGFDFHRYRLPDDIPVLVTLHLPSSWYPESIWKMPRNYHIVCVSENQRAACPARVRDRLRVIPNGVELPDPSALRDGGKYALMLSRICPEKNLHAGLDAARHAGLSAVLGGAVFPYDAHERYFAEEIAPRLTSLGNAHEGRPRGDKAPITARFVGPVAGEDKARLLSRAACLLLPSLAPETSSLVAMEALSFGTPVIGMAVGAVPEIIEDGRTGLLIQPGEDAVREMAAAISRLPQLSRKVCRAAAEVRFPFSRTLEAYQRLYCELASPDVVPSRARRRMPFPLEEASRATGVSARAEQQLSIDQVRSGEALIALVPEWERLWNSDPGATPFQHPAWLLPWWKQFGPEGELRLLTLRTIPAGDLEGFLPLYLYRQPQSGERHLLLLGAGTTDYLDGVWGARGEEVARKALDYARSLLRGSDAASLSQIRNRSPLARAAVSLGLGMQRAEPTSALDVASTLPAKILNNLRRYRRLAEIQGILKFSIVFRADEALAAFEELVILHTQRWQSRGEPGVLQDPRVLAHHREAIPQLLKAGLLCLFRLRLGEQTMGVLYGLVDPPHAHERRLYLYLIGFATQFATLSPGTLLLEQAFRYATDHGLAKVDLLRGGEEYKQLWGAASESTLTLLFPPL